MTARFILPLMIVIVAPFAGGCQQLPQSNGLLEQTAPDARLSSTKLRVLLTDYIGQQAECVEETADEILSQTEDVYVRRNALLWKSNGISAALRAASRPDPLAAFIDLWILNRQTWQLFEQTDRPPLFGPWQSLAVEACQRMEQSLSEIERMLGSDLPIGRPFVEAFAKEFPIDSLYFNRQSLAARYIEEVDEPTRELLEVVAKLSDNLAEMEKLSAIYVQFLPKHARWQAELAFLESPEVAHLTKAMDELGAAGPALSRMSEVACQLPLLVEKEREAVSSQLSLERQQVLADLDRMRCETVADLRAERTAVLAFLQEQTKTVSNSVGQVVDQEVHRVLGVVQAERQVITREVHQMVGLILRCFAVGVGAVCLTAVASVLCLVRSRRRTRAVTSVDEAGLTPFRPKGAGDHGHAQAA